MTHYEKVMKIFEAMNAARNICGCIDMTDEEIKGMAVTVGEYIEDVEAEAHTRGQHSVYMD